MWPNDYWLVTNVRRASCTSFLGLGMFTAKIRTVPSNLIQVDQFNYN